MVKLPQPLALVPPTTEVPPVLDEVGTLDEPPVVVTELPVLFIPPALVKGCDLTPPVPRFVASLELPQADATRAAKRVD